MRLIVKSLKNKYENLIEINSGVTGSYFLADLLILAAAFWTFCKRASDLASIPKKEVL